VVCVVSDSGARKGVGRKKKGTKQETNKIENTFTVFTRNSSVASSSHTIMG